MARQELQEIAQCRDRREDTLGERAPVRLTLKGQGFLCGHSPRGNWILSRQGQPKIAHRFNGGSDPQMIQPVPPGTTEPSPQGQCLSAARRFLPPLTGLGPRNSAVPTVETVGYFRLSLAGQRGMQCQLARRTPGEFFVFHALEALPLPGCRRHDASNLERVTVCPHPPSPTRLPHHRDRAGLGVESRSCWDSASSVAVPLGVSGASVDPPSGLR